MSNYKKIAAAVACVASVLALTACAAGPYDGRYDEYGVYHPGVNPPPGGVNAPSSHPGSENYTREDRYNYDARHYDRYDDEYYYTRRGYYDTYGAYYEPSAGPRVPVAYFPPAGMCRVWIPERAPANQPPAENCAGIRYRVPAGAYVIYGG